MDRSGLPAEIVEAVPVTLEAEAQIRLHEARCVVCRSSCRAEIEAAYVAWADPLDVAGAFEVSLRAIRIHAAVMGLDEARARGLGTGLARVVETALRVLDPAKMTPGEVLDYAKTAAALAGNAPDGSAIPNGALRALGARGAGPGETVTWEARVRASRRGQGA